VSYQDGQVADNDSPPANPGTEVAILFGRRKTRWRGEP
jgi:hypothetical protein